MEWSELYPIVKDQAQHAILRYEGPQRRKDKVQELVPARYCCWKRDNETKPQMLCNQRAKSVDVRSVCKKGYGGISTIDVLSFYRSRPDSSTPVVEFADWMTVSTRTKQNVDDTYSFNIDYKTWLAKLNKLQKRVLNYLIEGYTKTKIALKKNPLLPK